MRLLMLCWLAILALAGSPAMAEFPARPTGPILDAAAIIPDDREAALDQKLRAYNRDTGRAIIVATVPSLEGMEDERYAQDLARAWDIGGAESQEGVLILVAPTERKIRIQTAVGTQGRLTDGFVGRTIREQITPRFKAGDYAGGLDAGVDSLITQLNRDPTDAKAVAEAADAAEAARGQAQGSATMSSVVFWIVLIVFFIALFGRRGRRGAQRSGIDPGIVLWGISEVLHHASRNGGGSGWGGGGGGGGSDWGGFGGFGGGGGGFDGGGASGDW